MRCDRCGQQPTSTIMSRFNTDILCPSCETQERAHPRYKEAQDAEHQAVLRGDYNFPGIGKPEDL